MFNELKQINEKPKPFEVYTAEDLWTDEYTSKQMLNYHLNDYIDLSSRNRNFIEKSVDWIIAHFGVNENSKIIDFGCGPGLYTQRFAETGAKVTGIDFSKTSIEYAREEAKKNNLEIDYIMQNYLDYEQKEKFDLITMIFCDFCALSPEQRKVLLKKFYNLLNENGSILMDVHSMNIFNSREETATYEKNQLNGFWSPNEYYGFLNTFKYQEEKVTLDKYTIIEESRKRTVYNWLQYYSKDKITEEIEQNGLKVTEVFSDVAGTKFDPTSPDFAIVAKIDSK